MSVNDHRTKPVTENIFEIKAGENDMSATYVFANEDHTLGNALRHVLIRHPDTEFCGYSVPHPYDPKMNVRLQTTTNPSIVVLKDGLRQMEQMCDILDGAFDSALDEFKTRNNK